MATSQTKGLLTLNEQLRKIEREVNLSSFYGEGYAASELAAKPLVLVIGQYSTGKTTFIHCMTGMSDTSPDSGDAFVGGKSIVTDLESARP